jgi:hypothetical protein
MDARRRKEKNMQDVPGMDIAMPAASWMAWQPAPERIAASGWLFMAEGFFLYIN